MINFIKNTKVLLFAGGALAATLGGVVLKSEKTRQACVTVMAKGMKIKEDAAVHFEKIREDAEDLCSELAEEDNCKCSCSE
jgi:hypothetical protein